MPCTHILLPKRKGFTVVLLLDQICTRVNEGTRAGPEGHSQVGATSEQVSVKMCWVKAEPFQLAVSKGGPVPCALVSLPSAPITYTLSCTETIFKLDYFEAGQIHLPSMVLCPQTLPLCYGTTTWGFWVFNYISLKDGNGESILHVHFAMQPHVLLHVLCLSLLIWVTKDEKIAKRQRNVT